MSRKQWLKQSRRGDYLFQDDRKKGVSRQTERRIVLKAKNAALKSDLHYIDSGLADFQVQNFASPYAFNCLPVVLGDTQTNRTGKMIQVYSLHVRMDLYRNSASTSHDRMRILLVQVRKQGQTSNFSILNVLRTIGSVPLDVQAFRRIDEGDAPNFRVIKDWTIDLGFGTTDKSTRHIDYYKKFKKPLRVWYEGSADTDPNINALYLMAISDTSTNHPFLCTSTRATFAP